ncbi:MAG: electron transfer flavoprotein subunit beta/FixA family protein [Planctomycetaceae bacterium]|nr:electron transfer flavoprotein subunit beta/FixA family protein [Planctomycetaceae bacterium]
MEIVVCVKQVPDSQDLKINPRTNTLDRSGAALILNPADVSALEAARALKKKAGGSIRAISMGPASAEAVLRQTARKGVERQILATDGAFAGGDSFATAQVLRAAIMATGKYDLVLCGRRAIDGETGQVGGELAMLLGIPCLTNAFELWWENDRLLCRRLTEKGIETLSLPLPSLVTLCESYQERPPCLAEMRMANRAYVECFDRHKLGFEKGSSSIGLDGSKTKVRKIFTSDIPRRSCVLADNSESAARVTLAKIIETAKHAK